MSRCCRWVGIGDVLQGAGVECVTVKVMLQKESVFCYSNAWLYLGWFGMEQVRTILSHTQEMKWL